MNESKNKVPTMYESVPAVAAMNRVPGFEPVKLLRKVVSAKTNEEVLKLPLPCKKLWFRLANPKGKIRLNALRITEQLAIYEAQVYLDRGDTEPISSFTASCTKDTAPGGNYIQAAQKEAIDEALSDAGFGLQFVDVGMTEEALRYGSEIPLKSVLNNKSPETAGKVVVTGNPATAANQNVKDISTPAPITKAHTQVMQAAVMKQPVMQAQAVMQVPVNEQKNLPVEEATEELSLPVSPVVQSQETEAKMEEDTLPVQAAMVSAPAEVVKAEKVAEPEQQVLPVQKEISEAQRAMQILQRNPKAETGTSAAVAEDTVKQVGVEAMPKYDRSMPVPEILKLMTFEEAQQVVVDEGASRGWTMAEIAERRPASLKFYLFGGYKGGNNILLAAARIMYDNLEMKKAG